MSKHTPSDSLQHIQFEGCDVCVIAPEDYDALVAALESVEPFINTLSYVDEDTARHTNAFISNIRAALHLYRDQQASAPFCAGRNCKATKDDLTHSAECIEDHARSSGQLKSAIGSESDQQAVGEERG